jgi:hypothetical protein
MPSTIPGGRQRHWLGDLLIAAKLGVRLRRPVAGVRHWQRGSGARSRYRACRCRGRSEPAAADRHRAATNVLLRLVHPAVHHKVYRSFGQRRADPLPGAMPLAIVDQPVALPDEIGVQCVQRGPKLAQGRDGPANEFACSRAASSQPTFSAESTVRRHLGILMCVRSDLSAGASVTHVLQQASRRSFAGAPRPCSKAALAPVERRCLGPGPERNKASGNRQPSADS